MVYKIQDLSFAYASAPVLGNVSLAIGPGAFVAVIGPNGAGKSTLLKLMAGLLTGFRGTLEFGGRPLASWRPDELARKMAFVPQETHVVFPFTASEMMLMGRHASRGRGLFDTRLDLQAAQDAMALTRTEALADRTFNELSGGERQRVVLASALVQEPEVLLLDEPTVYLDLKHQLEFYTMLRHLHDAGKTIVAVTHDVNLAARYAKRMIVLHDGGIAADGSPDEVLTPETIGGAFGIDARITTLPEGGKYVIPAI